MDEPFRVSLSTAQTIAGLLISNAVALAALWVVVSRPVWVDKQHFRQARNIGTLAIAVGLSLVFVFWSNNDGMQTLFQVAVGGCALGFGMFIVNVGIQLSAKDATPGMIRVLSYLFTLIVYIVGGSMSLSASAVMLMVFLEPGQTLTEPTHVAVAVSGTRTVEVPGVPVPFSVTSGSLNFGCNQRVEAVARMQLPTGARVVDGPTASWQNVSNARDSSTEVTVSGLEVVARGSIAGLPAVGVDIPAFLGSGGRIENCPGGGHGEVVMVGRYVASERSATPFSATLQGELREGSLFLELPSGPDLELSDAIITVHDKGTPAADSPAMQLSLRPGVEPAEVSNAQITARRLPGRIEVVLRNDPPMAR